MTDDIAPLLRQTELAEREGVSLNQLLSSAAAEKLARRVEADHRDAEAAVAAGAEEDRLGQLLLKHRDSLPDVQVYRQRARDHDAMLAAARVQRLHHQTELRRLDDPEQALAALREQPVDAIQQITIRG